MLVSIIVPCYNEKNTIEKIVNRIYSLNIKKEIIIVDDGSTDGTVNILRRKIRSKTKKIIFHNKNMGKGAAIKSSLKFIKGEIVIIQDADLEYDPKDYYKLLRPFKNKSINVVYGSRVLGRKKSIFSHNLAKQFRIFGNHLLTLISNILNNQNLTDAHTCYKILRKNIFLKLKIKENGFSFCPEVTTKLSNLGIKIIEVPISYNGRSYKEGKKIGFKDAYRAINTIFKYKY
tara:strand:- start:79 stop:771 length:693 start_codon:yes stop_codon:yes gene_type:complete